MGLRMPVPDPDQKTQTKFVKGYLELTDNLIELLKIVAKGVVAPTKISEELRVDQATVSKYINQLKFFNLINETKHGREKTIALSEEGRKLTDESKQNKSKFAIALLL